MKHRNPRRQAHDFRTLHRYRFDRDIIFGRSLGDAVFIRRHRRDFWTAQRRVESRRGRSNVARRVCRVLCRHDHWQSLARRVCRDDGRRVDGISDGVCHRQFARATRHQRHWLLSLWLRHERFAFSKNDGNCADGSRFSQNRHSLLRRYSRTWRNILQSKYTCVRRVSYCLAGVVRVEQNDSGIEDSRGGRKPRRG